MGSRARWRISFGSSMRGAGRFMQSRTFSSVFNFMYLHPLQRQLSLGRRITSNVGAQMNSLPGHSFCIRWMMPDSVTTTNRFVGHEEQVLVGGDGAATQFNIQLGGVICRLPFYMRRLYGAANAFPARLRRQLSFDCAARLHTIARL